MAEIQMPGFVSERELPCYIYRLLDQPDQGDVILNFRAVRFYIPAAIVATIAQVRNWRKQNRRVTFRNHMTNPACGYLQRIDFFERVGLIFPDAGQRRDATGRFVPIEEVTARKGDAATISSNMAECVSPGGYTENDAYQLAQYACAEIITNCKQHAQGPGFVAAQYVSGRDTARVAIADSGRGIRRSFQENNSPHFFEGMTDLDAISAALRARVSSTTHLPHLYGPSPNFGVGLSMVRQLMQETFGYMVIISGNAWWYQDGKTEPKTGTFNEGQCFNGTICSVAFLRAHIADYNAMLQEARVALGLTGEAPPDNLFL